MEGHIPTIVEGPVNVPVRSMDDGYFVAGSVQGKSLVFLVDTGSCCTILSKSLFDRWSPETRPNLTPVNLHLVTATGDSIPTLGKAEIEISLGSQCLLHDVLFADIKNDGILGVDFLSKHKCDVFLSKDHMRLNGERISCFHSSKGAALGTNSGGAISTCCRIAILEGVEIPPESEIVVKGRPLDLFDKNSVGTLEGTSQFVDRSGLLVARALVSPETGSVPIRIMNLNDQPFFLHKNTVTAIYEPVETERLESVNSLSTKATSDENPYQHIDELIQNNSSNLNETQLESLKSLLYEHKDQFSKSSHDLGCSNLVEHTIKTVPDCKPVKLRPYRVPLAKREFAESEVKAMAEKGLIEPSYSAWSAPAIIVPKPDGSLRFCVDYRRLNELTVPDSHQLPRIDDTLDALGGSTWFSTLDLKSGFHQVSIAEEDRPKTAFSIPGSGLWQWRVLPFGLINSPSVFERLMERVFAGLTFLILLIYLDDIIVFSKTFEEHLINLRKVFERLKEANLKLNSKKCKLLCRKVSFLGHEVSNLGIGTDPKKLLAVNDWPQPKTATEVRQFVGLASYYRKFIPNFATVCKPLHQLTEKNNCFAWTEKCQNAFDNLKKLLTSAPILSYPLLQGQRFLIDCDASNVGVGAVLSQIQDGEEKVISYFSKCLSRTERKYCTTRKELLAVVMAVKNFHHFLFGQQFTVRTDHGSLQWLMRFKNCEGQIARWLEVLSAYTFTIVHRAGRVHNNADSLSRRPCYSNDCKHCDRYEKRYFPKVSPEIDRTEKETNIFEKTDGGWGDSTLRSVTPVEMINTVEKIDGGRGGSLLRSVTPPESINYDEKDDGGQGDSLLLSVMPPECTNNIEKIDGGRGDSLLRSVTPPESIINEHIDNAPVFETQEDSPDVKGPVICDDIYVSDRLACSITPSLGPGVAEVLSLEMTHGNYQTGVPHFTHASNNSVCGGVDAEAHKIIDKCRHTSCYCCEVTADYIEDWIDLFEDGPLFGCLFENGIIPEELQVARAGMATISEGVHSDKPRCHCERRSEMIDTNTLIKGIVQDGQECGYSICKNKLCLNVSQHLSESDKSSASTSKSVECLDITLENIRDQQEKDATLKLLLQWKRSKEKPHWSAVAPYCRELKAYWHEWDTIELKDNVLYKKDERGM